MLRGYLCVDELFGFEALLYGGGWNLWCIALVTMRLDSVILALGILPIFLLMELLYFLDVCLIVFIDCI